jgi:hypothetical protein
LRGVHSHTDTLCLAQPRHASNTAQQNAQAIAIVGIADALSYAHGDGDRHSGQRSAVTPYLAFGTVSDCYGD